MKPLIEQKSHRIQFYQSQEPETYVHEAINKDRDNLESLF
jgi:hypothetical protein